MESKLRSLIVVRDHGPKVLGRHWMKTLALPWHEIIAKEHIESIDTKSRSDSCRSCNRGCPQGKRRLCTTVFHTDISYLSLESQGKTRTRAGEGENTTEPVRLANWAAPIVSILKADGSNRVCGDYRLTIN